MDQIDGILSAIAATVCSSGARGNDYEAANGAIGMVTQAMLWKISGGAEQGYLDGVYQTLRDWLPYLTTYQVR